MVKKCGVLSNAIINRDKSYDAQMFFLLILFCFSILILHEIYNFLHEILLFIFNALNNKLRQILLYFILINL